MDVSNFYCTSSNFLRDQLSPIQCHLYFLLFLSFCTMDALASLKSKIQWNAPVKMLGQGYWAYVHINTTVTLYAELHKLHSLTFNSQISSHQTSHAYTMSIPGFNNFTCKSLPNLGSICSPWQYLTWKFTEFFPMPVTSVSSYAYGLQTNSCTAFVVHLSAEWLFWDHPIFNQPLLHTQSTDKKAFLW